MICSFISITATAQKRTVIELDSIPSKSIIKDLEKGDLCNQKLAVSLQRIEIKERTINNLEAMVNIMEISTVKLKGALNEKDKSIGFQVEIIANNEKQIKIAKRKFAFWKLATLVLTGALGYEILK